MRSRGIASVVIAPLALLLLLTPLAPAKPRLAGVFDLSGQPQRIARGPDGNMWVTLGGGGNTLARIRPNGTVNEFAPLDVINPIGIGAGPDGNLWLTRNGGVIKVPPGDPNAAAATDIGDIGDPREIVAGPGGRLWTASGDKLVSFLPGDPGGSDSDTITGMAARGITASGGRLWIADFGGQRIANVTPAGAATFIDVGGNPRGVAAGPPRTIAYTNPGTDPHTVGRIKQGGTERTTNAPNTDAEGITYAADGNWWTGNFLSNDLGILSPKGTLRRFDDLPANVGPRFLAAGPRGTVWVAFETTNQVARIKGVTPQTRIRKGPRGEVPVDGDKAKVRFKFKSSAARAKFKCKLKGAGRSRFKRCKARKTYRLGPGEYKLLVRATHMGATDPTPAKRKFEVVG